MPDKVSGVLQVGTNNNFEVVINHPDLDTDQNGVGHIVFSPRQARGLAALLIKKAKEAEAEDPRRADRVGSRRARANQPRMMQRRQKEIANGTRKE